MARKVILERLATDTELRNRGVTIRVEDPGNPKASGRLRVAKRVFWKPAGKGYREKARNWEELIDFFMS